ncbi:hypothetical protein T492DRAFT_832548 [Pavlovales sp. CCMP2436]|nr:hypothetical protein T492DRAFT_832548 [Pavlovales sp. CCMP2436]
MRSLTRTAHAVAAVAAVALTLAALGTLCSQAPPELVAPQPPRAENTTELANECSLANEQCRLNYILNALATAGSAGDMLGSVPIPSVVPHPAFSAAKFACTPDNVSPKSAGPPVSFVPCCTGSAPVNITRTEFVCKPTTPTTNKFLDLPLRPNRHHWRDVMPALRDGAERELPYLPRWPHRVLPPAHRHGLGYLLSYQQIKQIQL